MTQETQDKLARSLTAETAELLPYLPYLLQDLWEIGSSPQDIIKLMKKHMSLSSETKVLDLACGKGAVSVKIAESLGVNVYGFDLIPEFLEYARQKAEELNVSSLCHFARSDINELIGVEKDYDLVVYGAAGDALGCPQEILQKLASTIKPGGYAIIDEAYLPEGLSNDEVHYKNYEYLTLKQWMNLFTACGFELLEELQAVEHDYDSDTNAIAARTDELSSTYPDKRDMFEGYVKSQQNEVDDLESNVTAVTWMLRRV